MEVVKEKAVKGSRRSQSHFYERFKQNFDFRQDVLRNERREFCAEVPKRQARGESFDDITEALQKNQIQQTELDAKWRRSKFRQGMERVETRDTEQGVGDTEQRISGTANVPVVVNFHGAESRAATGAKTLVGYAAKFNKFSQDLGYFGPLFEVIRPGAFKSCIADSDIRCLLNHSADHVMGRKGGGSKSLRVYEDKTGLLFYCDLIAGDSLSESVAARVERRDISQCSFCFSVADGGDDWDVSKDGETIRMIIEVSQLYDVSPVTYPAYLDTSCSIETKSDGRADGPVSTAWAEKELERYDERKRAEPLPFDVRHEIKVGYEYAGRLMERLEAKV